MTVVPVAAAGALRADPGRAARLARLRAVLAEVGDAGGVSVAFSGGADSALLAWVALDTLGRDLVDVVTAVSPSLHPDELEDCRALASEWALPYREVATDELDRPEYVANGGDRCAHCKSALMDALDALAPEATGDGGAEPPRGRTILLGVNVDDLGDHRPGQEAARLRGARFPFVEAGLGKDDVRAISSDLGLRTWDKPAAACLASRIPYGTPVTVSRLSGVARAEAGLRALGFASVRVRHYGDTARVEVPVAELAGVLERRSAVVEAVRSAGFAYVTLDLDGLRSGNLNAALGLGPGPDRGGEG